jgi:ABC-type lipoprotein export system ATPase subunit
MITHNEELAEMTDRTLEMRDGNIVEEHINKAKTAETR